MGKKELLVKNLDIATYMGRWYEVASFPSLFFRAERQCGTYTLNEDGTTVHVLNETWSKGKRYSIEGTAYKADASSDEAKLKVKFLVPPFLPIIPVYGDYWVLFIDEDYQYVLIGEPRRKFLQDLERMARNVLFVFLLIQSALAKKSTHPAPPAQKWLTLSGERPEIIARGGMSGLFPESSEYAFQFAIDQGVTDVMVYCDVQFTKTGLALCQKDVKIDNSTNIAGLYPKGERTYFINGHTVQGWFTVDYTDKEIFDKVALVQSLYTRPDVFDNFLRISTVEDLVRLKPAKIWLNVQYDMFYKEHKVDVGAYIQKASSEFGINYISSPEVGLLKSLAGKLNGRGKSKLVLKVLGDADAVEPTTKKTYTSILKDLASIKTYASGILVPKNLIWPVNAKKYLEPHTSLVLDAHKIGLEVHASGFANDFPASFNYSYDPTAEYIQFVDNSMFSVDGVLTDFSTTASEAIACLANRKNATVTKLADKVLIISNHGASGVYPPCSNLAYQQAIDDGVDIIDCTVQMTQDGVPFCMQSPDLMASTNAMTAFMSRSRMIPEIQPVNGIFSFDLKWSEIQTVKPQLYSPLDDSDQTTDLPRNPINKNAGKLITLAEFLELAKAKAVSGVLININNAGYLASKKGLSIIDAVDGALKNATFDKQVTQKVMIESDDTSVLAKFKNVPSYKKILTIEDIVGGAAQQSLDEVKKFADTVNLYRSSIIENRASFSKYATDIVDRMHSANISVYVSVFRNEYTTIVFDFFSDPIVEIATYVSGIGVDGLVTDYPGTASSFKRSPCFDPNSVVEYPILPLQPGSLINLIPRESLAPAEAPAPDLTEADVLDPPLPPVSKLVSAPGPASAAADGAKKSGQTTNVPNLGLCLVTLMLLSFLYLGHYH